MEAKTFFSGNLVPCAGILFLIFFLRKNTVMDRDIKGVFYQTILLELAEMAAYNAEVWTASFPEPTVFRILLSAIGYSLRPVILYMLLVLVLRNEERNCKKLLFAVPAVINGIVAFSAFFTDIAYSYDAQNQFHRGPLGFFSQFFMLLYLFIILAVVFGNRRKDNQMEASIILGISVYVTVTLVIEAIFRIRTVERMAIVISTIFYYMFCQTRNFQNSLDEEQQLREDAEEKAQIDSLTGILNKGAFLKAAQKSLSAAGEGYGAFLFLDLDHFKDVNDQLGHLMGDEVLKDVTYKLRKSFREYDIIGRFGGDEFCVLLENISNEVLCRRLDAMVDLIRGKYTSGEATVGLSVSVGAVYFKNEQDLKLHDIIDLADRALYSAKKTGRDKYIVHNLNC